jgi:hypothetical protein
VLGPEHGDGDREHEQREHAERNQLAPMLPASPEKKNDSKTIVAISAIDAPATTSCPNGVAT